MNMFDLARHVAEGFRPTVTFRAGIDNIEGYPERNMKARIVGTSSHQDGVVVLMVDYDEFEQHNIGLEQPNYYDDRGVPCLTAHESDWYESTEQLYFMGNDDVAMYATIDDESAVKIFKEYQTSNSNDSYVTWLERQLTAARANQKGVD